MITLFWANINTLCWPTFTEPSELEATTPIPHSSRISWRATNFGEWWSLWSSEIMSALAGKSSDRRQDNECGIFSPMTSNGWLQIFITYGSDWNIINKGNKSATTGEMNYREKANCLPEKYELNQMKHFLLLYPSLLGLPCLKFLVSRDQKNIHKV